MDIDRQTAQRWFSLPRFEAYLRAANYDDEAALALYEWNSQVASALLEDLQYLEVALRNAVDNVLRPLEVDSRARREEHAGWWFNSETFLTAESLEVLRRSRATLPFDDQHMRGKVLANTSFGFWVKLFGKAYDPLWRTQLHKVFPHIPAGSKRQWVSGTLDDLRKARNRAAHHEPVHQLDLHDLRQKIVDICAWMDAGLAAWVSKRSRLPELLANTPSMPNALAVVVPARIAWPFYEQQHAYVCQPNRFFREVNYIAFYAESEIKPDVARIVHQEDDVEWTTEEVGRRYSLKNPRDRRIADVIKASLESGWDQGGTQQVFLLTSRGDVGHEELVQPITNPRRGVGSGYVRRQRYFYVHQLKVATTTNDLQTGPSKGDFEEAPISAMEEV